MKRTYLPTNPFAYLNQQTAAYRPCMVEQGICLYRIETQYLNISKIEKKYSMK